RRDGAKPWLNEARLTARGARQSRRPGAERERVRSRRVTKRRPPAAARNPGRILHPTGPVPLLSRIRPADREESRSRSAGKRPLRDSTRARRPAAAGAARGGGRSRRSEEHTSELQSREK